MMRNEDKAIRRLIWGLQNPLWIGSYIISKFNPELLFRRYVQLAKEQGIDKPYFILSFDCDTEKDTDVVEEVHSRLIDMEVMPMYAVPGELIEKRGEVYKRIASTGAVFMNHGYKLHTYYDHELKEYKSCFFYDELSHEEIIHDIKKGHQTHKRIFGKDPTIFRAPHFGAFQGHSQLTFLHGVLGNLGYKYSSSTVPFYAFRYGPLIDVGNGLREIPVSGCFDNPLSILDSWGFLSGRFGNKNEKLYKAQMTKMVLFFSKNKLPSLLNFYVDPSHVVNADSFFQAINFAKKLVTFIDSYKRLEEIIR
jgi:hypothetical protein